MMSNAMQTFDILREAHERRRLSTPRAVGLLDRIIESWRGYVPESKAADLEAMENALRGYITFGQDVSEEGEAAFSARLDRLLGDEYVNDPASGWKAEA
jgi:hypothetical protein